MTPGATHDIRAQGALGDGRTVDTAAIQAAIDACAEAGGGTVVVPPGCYLTGSIVLRSRIELRLSAGATLAGAVGSEHYPVIDSRYGGYVGFNAASEGGAFTQSGAGGDVAAPAARGVSRAAHRPLIFADDEEDLVISGPGTIDGQGAPWWALKRSGRLERARPTLIGLNRCRRVTIRDVRLVDSPSWTVHPVLCTDVAIRGVRITNPPDAPNTDGIDPDSCSGVVISDCTVDVGDDCVCIKSGNEVDGREVGTPCENVVISNCIMRRGHGGVVVGSEISGGVEGLLVSNCVFDSTDRGIRIKSRRRRGGWARDLSFSNIVMRDVWCPLVVNAFYHCGSDPADAFIHGEAAQPVDETTPVFSDIRLAAITCRGATSAAGFVWGLPEMPVRRLSLRDVHVEVVQQPDRPARVAAMALAAEPTRGAGFLCRYAEDVRLDGVSIRGAVGEPWRFEECERVEGASR
ncbi:MAG: glycoside hydrolase family 28 protein [Spirochaetota bacterium]